MYNMLFVSSVSKPRNHSLTYREKNLEANLEDVKGFRGQGVGTQHFLCFGHEFGFRGLFNRATGKTKIWM
jgi:hypothetical protein